MGEARRGARTLTDHPADRLEGHAPAIAALRAQIRHLVGFDAVGRPTVPTLLLQGETGTGKGLVARVVHDSGPRAGGPFVPVNCAAIPETMLEAELFGFEPGAFTDARRGKTGLFDAASGGTLFLDEIDSLSLTLQSKILTAIESKRIRRLGAVTEHPVDVKLIVATQYDLAQLAADGHFRPDLYHRLAVIVLTLPPLRERGDDAVRLAGAMLERFATAYGTAPKRLAADAEAWLTRHRWPGNVRELGHLMERVTLLHEDVRVDASALDRLVTAGGGTAAGAPAMSPMTTGAAPESVGESAPAGATSAPSAVADEAQQIRAALARSGGNVLKTARLLGVSRDTVRYRMRRHGISRDEPASGEPEPPPRPPETPADTLSSVPAWEQKPVAIVAVELVWPERRTGGVPRHDAWTEAARWERVIGEKLAGFGGVMVQRNPSLIVWAFGVPRALDQIAQRAVHGACAVRNLTAALTRREQVPELRIAVHLGTMVVDTASDDPVPGALPVGATLTLPIRLLARTRPGEILASEEIGRQVDAWVTLDPVTSSMPGDRPGTVFRIEGLSPWRERGTRQRRAPLRSFVGRESERAALHGLLDVAAAGAGQVLGISGEPGVGKSRLLYEFRTVVRDRGARYAETHCLAYGTATPYLPIIALLRGYFEIADADPPRTVNDKVRAGLAGLDLDAAAHAPSLLSVLGDESEADPPRPKEETFEAFRAMALVLARRQPLVLTVENVHWIDPTSEECLALLAESVHGAPLLLIMTYRPGYRPPWLGRSYASQIALRPLGVDPSRSLLRSVVGDASLRPEVEEQVLSRAEGNPFFLEELGRAVVEHGGTEPLRIPETVQAVLAARIDRLAADDKRLLQAAAVLGRTVSLPLLERLSGLNEPTLAPRVARLLAGEFLVEAPRRAEPAYTFKHALTQAAAYAGLRPEVRRALHLKAAEALESQAGAARPEAVEQFARHAAEGGAWHKAVIHLRRAAGLAAARGARREAVACYERALAILEKVSDSEEAQDPLGDIRFMLPHALYMAGDFARALDGFRAARSLAEKAGDARRLSQILAGLSYVHASEGRYAEAAEAGEEALAIANTGDIAVSLWTSFGLARAHFALGRYRRAADSARWAVEALAPWPVDERFGGRAGNLLPAVAARSWLALALARTGDFDEGTRAGEEAVRAAEAVDGLQERVWAYYCLGRLHHARTDFARAVPMLRQALSLAEGGTVPIYFTRVLSGLGSALYQSGDVEEALPLLRRARDEGRGLNFLYGHSLIVVQLGEACLAAGRLDEAETHAADALALSRRMGERGDEAWALLLHGEIAAARAPHDVTQARRWLGDALALAVDLEMRPLAAQCRTGIGSLELSAGRHKEAERWLAPAAEDLRAMGIPALGARVEQLRAVARGHGN